MCPTFFTRKGGSVRGNLRFPGFYFAILFTRKGGSVRGNLRFPGFYFAILFTRKGGSVRGNRRFPGVDLFCHTFFIQHHFFENIFHYFFTEFIFLFFSSTTQSNQCKLSEFFICRCIIDNAFWVCQLPIL